MILPSLGITVLLSEVKKAYCMQKALHKHSLNEQIEKEQRQSYVRHSFCPEINAEASTPQKGALPCTKHIYFYKVVENLI